MCVNGSRAKLKTTFDSIFYSGAITCFVYPIANRTLLLQERTGHLGAQPVETHLYPNCFSSNLSSVLTAILNSQAGYRCTLVPRLPFPVPRSPFPVPRSPFPVPRSPFPVPRSPFPVLVTSVFCGLKWRIWRAKMYFSPLK